MLTPIEEPEDSSVQWFLMYYYTICSQGKLIIRLLLEKKLGMSQFYL